MPARKPQLTKRDRSDAEADAMLADLPWSDDISADSRQMVRDVRWEFYSLSEIVRDDPTRRTPAVEERLDALRREYRQLLKEFGLDPVGRKELGIKPSAVKTGGVTYRRMTNPWEVVLVLVNRGVWDAIGAKARTELAEQDNTTEGNNDEHQENEQDRSRVGAARKLRSV